MKRKTTEIRRLIMTQVDDFGKIMPSEVAKKYNVSRQAVYKNLQALVSSGVLIKTDSPKHPYLLKPIRENFFTVHVTPDTEENKIWIDSVAPFLQNLKGNVREICHYGFTEMFNNVIDHSESQLTEVRIIVDALVARMIIQDHGVGIWKKLQKEFDLDDPRHAILELSKGKLTTDPKKHTGEGIFFTSRMFDKFYLASEKLRFCRFQESGEWLFDVKWVNVGSGTRVDMTVYLDSKITPKKVFDKFTAEYDDFGFTKTHLSVQLAKYEGDQLVSRSQAKRILHRLDKFKEVYLDFRDITSIGMAFADEIFRVFQNEHQSILLIPVNTSPAVEKMINKAKTH